MYVKGHHKQRYKSILSVHRTGLKIDINLNYFSKYIKSENMIDWLPAQIINKYTFGASRLVWLMLIFLFRKKTNNITCRFIGTYFDVHIKSNI